MYFFQKLGIDFLKVSQHHGSFRVIKKRSSFVPLQEYPRTLLARQDKLEVKLGLSQSS